MICLGYMKKLDRIKLIQLARRSVSFEELADQVGWKKKDDHGMETFVKEVGRICPGIEVLTDVHAAETELKDSLLDPVARKAAREVLIGCVAKAIDEGFGLGTKADVPARVGGVEASTECLEEWMRGYDRRKLGVEQEAQLDKFRKGLKAVTECIACDGVKKDVLGYVGEEYYGRPLVWFVIRPGIFVKEMGGNAWLCKVTLHKGILNQTSLRELPSLNWMILDVMADLGQFTEKQVIDQAVEFYYSERDKKKYTSKKKFRKDLEKTYYVMRTHHWNTMKRLVGMGYMVVGVPSHRGAAGVQEIRGRKAHETYEYFQEHLRKMEVSKAGTAPMASLD